jgi:hypothetical protein
MDLHLAATLLPPSLCVPLQTVALIQEFARTDPMGYDEEAASSSASVK